MYVAGSESSATKRDVADWNTNIQGDPPAYSCDEGTEFVGSAFAVPSMPTPPQVVLTPSDAYSVEALMSTARASE